MADIPFSEELAWSAVNDIKDRNSEVETLFWRNGDHPLFSAMLKDCHRVWDTVPQTVQKAWMSDNRFYRHLLESFDYKKNPPALKSRPIEITWEILEALTP